MNKAVLILLFVSFMTGVAKSADKQNFANLRPPKNGGVYVIAHRGAHLDIPENTLPAYQKAIELGVDFVEVDIRTTKDSQFVSIHNSNIDAYVAGATGKVNDFTLEELRRFDVGVRVAREWQGTTIPTFEEILQLCQGKCGIYLDLKQAPVEPLLKLIKKYKMENEVIWYADFDELRQLKKLCPECIPMPDPGPEKNLPAMINLLHPKVIAAVWRYYSQSFVETCHQAGAIVIVDESNPSCWEQALQWGSDGIQTDFPEELIKFLQSKSRP